MCVIDIREVSKSFRDAVILKDVNIQIKQGEIVGIVGRNGSGKTVLLKLICGLLLPTTGTVQVFGKQLGKDRDFPVDTGLLIETPDFLPYQTAYQSLRSLALIRRQVGKEEIKAVLRQVGLDPESRKPVGKYSLGMRQRLGIAQALLEQPKLLLLDEPMNGLDAAGAEEMRRLFRSLKENGTTIVLATHIREDIDGLCERVYRIDNAVLMEERIDTSSS